MTNARELAERLKKDCSRDHQRIKLEGGNRTRQSEVYPEELCKEIVRGLKDQMKVDGRMTDEGLGTVCAVEERKRDNESYEEEIGRFGDDMSGKELDPEKVRAAREEEMKAFQRHQLYETGPNSGMLAGNGQRTDRSEVGRCQQRR